MGVMEAEKIQRFGDTVDIEVKAAVQCIGAVRYIDVPL